MKKTLIITIFISLISTLGFSQKPTQTVRGIVTDIDSKQALIGVVVKIVGTQPLIAVSTDANGVFRLPNVPIGSISLQLSFVGYEPTTIPNIDVNSGKEVILDISMKESIVKVDEVVVSSNYKKGEAVNDMTMISVRSISQEETKRFTGGMDDPARVVSSFAGVAATADGSSDIIVRGNSPKYLQWRIDGIEIASPYHMDDQNASTGALTALNNKLLAKSDFFTGAFSSEYGNVLSSVMDVKLRTGNNEKFEGTAGIGLLGTDLTFEGPFKKGYAGSYMVNYRYSTISLIQMLGLVDVPGDVRYQDAAFKIVLPTERKGTFSIFGLGGLSGFNIKQLDLVPGSSIKNGSIKKDYEKGNYLANLGLNHTLPLSNNSFLKTSLSYSGTGISDDIYESTNIYNYDNAGNVIDSVFQRKQTFKNKIDNSVYRVASTFNSKINARNKIQIGTKYSLSGNKYNQNVYNDSLATMMNVNDFNKNIGTVQNFVNWRSNLCERITLIAGVHNLIVLSNKKYTIEPRIAINWKIGKTGTISAGYGKHSMMESVHNYYTKVPQKDGTTIEPNINLDVLKANHYVLGYEKRLSENMRAKVEVYYQHLYNLPVENNDTSYYATINEGIDYRYVALVNKGVGKNYGIEFTLERFFARNYYYLINASLFDSKYKSLEGVWRNTQYNNKYLVNVLFGKEFKNLGKKQNQTLAVNAKLLFTGGKPYIPLVRDAQGNVAVDPSKDQYWDYKNAYSKKLDNVFQLNLSASYKWNKAKTTHELFLDLMNLTNNQARISEYYDASKPNKVGYVKQFQMFPNLMYRMYF